MQNQINITPITLFIQQLRAAEQTQAKEVKIPIQQARNLNMALTEILEKMNKDYETMYNQLKNSVSSEVITVEFDGGTFGDSK